MSEDRKTIDKLCDVLLVNDEEIIKFQDYGYRRPVMDAIRMALDVMVIEQETQYQVGYTIAIKAIHREAANDDNALWSIWMLARACRQLSQMTEAAKWIAPRKFLAVLS